MFKNALQILDVTKGMIQLVNITVSTMEGLSATGCQSICVELSTISRKVQIVPDEMAHLYIGSTLASTIVTLLIPIKRSIFNIFKTILFDVLTETEHIMAKNYHQNEKHF